MPIDSGDIKSFLKVLVIGLVAGLAIGLAITYVPKKDAEKERAQQAQDQAAMNPTPAQDDARMSQKVVALYAATDHLYVSLANAGVIRTKDGETWETLRAGLDDPKMVQAFAEVRPTKETLTAKFMEMGQIEGPPDEEAMKKAFMALAQQQPGILAGTSDSRILRLDEGAWKVIANLPADGGGVYSLRYEPAVGLAACTGRGLYFSPDAGSTWNRVTQEARTRDVLIGLDPERRFLVAQYGGGATICNTGGKCERIKGLPEMLRRVIGDNTLHSTWFGTDGDGLWRIEGSAAPAAEKTSALDNADVTDLVVIGGRIIAAGGPQGLWIRKDAKSGWFPAIGLPPDSIKNVAVFKGRIYAGTQKFGLFSASLDGDRFIQISY